VSPTAEQARWRRARTCVALVSVLTLVLGLAACGDDEDGPGPDAGPDAGPTAPTPTATLDATQLDFDASVEVTGEEVVVTWSLTNRSGAPVLVANRVPDDAGRLSESADQTYVLPGARPDQVELAKRVLWVGGDAAGDSLPWVGVTELADGRALAETVRVALPLEAYAPASPDLRDLRLPDPATSVVFCVGVLSGRRPEWGLHQDGGVDRVDHGIAVTGQTTRCSEPADLP
jgi:hypothetical protein